MSRDWAPRAGVELLALRAREGGWGYRRDSEPCVEPTVLAALALQTLEPRDDPATRSAVMTAADLLSSLQRRDGSLGLSASQPTPGWMTPYAVLLWASTRSHDTNLKRACEWLLSEKGRTLPRSDDPGGVAGHDTTLVGWPWVEDTHSWLEPTVLAVLALGAGGLGDHPRVREGLTLIRNRAVESGGWNYGNRAVFGRPLRAQPAPTGLALLALAGTESPRHIIERATRYLIQTLPSVRAPISLGWGLLGLHAWGIEPDGQDEWLAESFRAVTGRLDAAPRLAPLLLAACPDACERFGRSSTRMSAGAALDATARPEATEAR
ncbi:MAG: hypothetical protein U0794_04665 [Isosphaeraceae bacterium]